MNLLKKFFAKKNILIFFIFLLLPVFVFAKVINVVSVNDFHGRLMEYGKNVGMAKLVTVLKHEKEWYPNTIIVFGGDNYEGSPISDLSRGAPVSQMMKEVGVKVTAVGNHEFFRGIEQFKKWEKDSGAKFLAANIFDRKTNKLVPWAKPYLIIKQEGVKIAFIGLATQETPYTTNRANVKDFLFKGPANCAQKWIDYLKEGKDPAGKPDAIIALTHIPSKQDFTTGKITGSKELFSLCNNTKGLDAVISAHSHLIVSGYVNNIPVIQAYCYGRAIGHLKLIFNKENKLIKVIPYVDVIYKRKNDIQPDAEAAAVIAKYMRVLPSNIHEVIGHATADFYHSIGQLKQHPLDTWICGAMRKAYKTQIGMLNGGSVRDILPAGSVTRLSVLRVFPFHDTITTLKITGKTLYGMMEDHIASGIQFSGLKVYYNPNASFGHRVVKITLLDGTPIDKKKYYSVAANQFMVGGGDNESFPNAIDINKTAKSIKDVIVARIIKEKTISPTKENNLILK